MCIFLKKIFFRLFALWIIYDVCVFLKQNLRNDGFIHLFFLSIFLRLTLTEFVNTANSFIKLFLNISKDGFDKSNVNSNKRWKNVPVFGSSRSISLPSIFEPIANLCWCQTSRLGQFAFFCWIWIRILKVPFAQKAACSLFKAMCLLFTIPNGAWQRKLFPNTIFINGTCNNRIWPI